jgi:mannosyltransferase
MAGAALRFHAIAAKSFWLDEGFSAEIVRLRWSDFLRVLWNREANMTLYYLLLRAWMHLGSREAVIRGLSALIASATVPLLYLLGKRMFGRAAGLLGAWLLAVNAYHVRYAQEARSYALLVFLAILCTWLLVRNLQEPARAHWGLYAAVCALTVYTHFYGGLLVIAHVAALCFAPRREIAWNKVLRSLLVFAISVIPVAAFVLLVGIGPIGWIGPLTLTSTRQFIVAYLGNGGVILSLFCAVPIAIALWQAISGTALTGSVLKTAPEPPDSAALPRRWPYVLSLLWFFVPVLIVILASFLHPVFVARYMIFCLPALTLLMAAGLVRIRPLLLTAALLAGISVFSIQATIALYHSDIEPGRADWRSASAYILDHASPGDAVFFTGHERMPFEYYRSLRRRPVPWPQSLEFSPGPNVDARDFLLATFGNELRETRQTRGRLWVIFGWDPEPGSSPSHANAILQAVYGGPGRLVESQRFSNITVLLFEPESAN